MDMPAFPATRWSRRRSSIGRPPPGGEEGFLLLEVIVSAALLGVVVIATMTGFAVVNRTSSDQRFHSQAAVLAAESQEELRSDPASTLQTLQTSPHSYAQTIGGTTYTIVQRAELQPASGSNAACSVTENKRQSGNSYRITSTATWPQLVNAGRASLVASSLITPPTGSALEVDADNAPTVTAGVSGITATINYTPVGASTQVSLSQTTGAGGCVVFGAIPATSALVEIAELTGYVTRTGAPKYPTKEVTIAPNYTTHYPILYNRGGAIKAEYTYNAKTEYSHTENSGTGTVKEAITGDSFVAFNALMEAAPDYEVGSTRYATATTVYNPIPGTYEAAATSPSDLFPFAETEAPWSVYAGDCVENNPKEVTTGVVKPPEKLFVNAGATTTAAVPTSLVTLNLYKGTEAEATALGTSKWKNLETTARPVTITNSECAGTTPNNESTINVKHKQETTSGPAAGNAGHLTHPFQPFAAEAELCVYVSPKAYKRTYEDKTLAGPTIPIYIGQRSTQEKSETRIKEEKTEAETQEKRETTEATTKKNAEALEATELKQWEKERSRNEISASTLTTKKNNQKAAKTTRENSEATTRKAAETAETATETARKTKETKETTEAATSKVTVETSAECA
jgi:Tfp pilus assembly protein PilV